ncbi:MAG TPA: class 1 fructose-bisphosphatase [Flavobacteriales bacterium]|nr:class 1 fructose-bisphosphatase [Flavobacteriales bacterium]
MLSLKDFIYEQDILPCNNDEVWGMLESVTDGAVKIHEKVIRAGLSNILGTAGIENVQGEQQQKLDVIANDIFIEAVRKSELFASAASEENKEIIKFKDSKNAPFVIAFDPLDGSSNIDVNVSIGTIFSVYKRPEDSTETSDRDYFQVGDNQILAGYVIYGTSTMLVMSTGNGVNGFTLNPDNNEFYLSHRDMIIPKTGRVYSVNEGNYDSFSQGLKDYISYCKSDDNDREAAYSARYIGSMVADLHRNLLKGGIFMYPATTSAPNGKLRLLYECHPMAFVIENAGGKASSGEQRILDIQTSGLHQRIPIFLGSESMMDTLMDFISKKETSQ